MSFICVKNGTLIMPRGTVDDTLWIKNDIIAQIGGEIKGKSLKIIDAKGCYVTPGLIDIHIHGGKGCNFLENSTEQLITLKQDLLRHGVTTFIPTIMTAGHDIMLKSVDFFTEYNKNQRINLPKAYGINLEGPFLSSKYKGIHSEEELKPLTSELLDQLITDEVKIITIAPELDDDNLVSIQLSAKGIIVAMGHSSATYSQATEAHVCGVDLVTHLYNAMGSFHHREPGIVATALLENNLSVEIIADGVHVHPASIKILVKCKSSEKIVLISDAIALRDDINGEYSVGNDKIFIRDGKAVNDKGILSGSITTLDCEIRNLVKWDIVDFKTAVNYASFNPAKLLKIDNKVGTLLPNTIADLVIWDKKSLSITAVIISGVYYNLSA